VVTVCPSKSGTPFASCFLKESRVIYWADTDSENRRKPINRDNDSTNVFIFIVLSRYVLKTS
jgi:hypothetical protein